MLTVQNVCAGYGGVDVVHNVSFTLPFGQTLCIVGPNGCGKTTLLRAVAGLLSFAGSVCVEEVSLRGMKRADVARRIAILGQMSTLYFSYSVWDTVLLGRYPHLKGGVFAKPSQEDHAKAEACLRTVDLWADRDKPLETLSGGQRQRAYLARTLAQEPNVILLDEPTNHLDLKYQVELVAFLRTWAAQDRHAVVGVLHDVNLARELADQVLLMQAGHVRALGPPQEALNPALLREVFEMDVAGYMRRALARWPSE